MSGDDSPAHKRSRLYRFLERPALYRWIQRAVGAARVRRTLVEEYVRPGAGDRLLDIGCGPADLLDFLPASVSYYGCDINAAYIAHARARYGSRGRFLEGTVGDLIHSDLHGPFDRILLVALLHHLEDDEAKGLLDLASRLLAPDGHLITLDNVLLPSQPAIARFLIGRDRGARPRTQGEYLALLRSTFPTTEGEVRHDLLRIPYTHFIGRAALEQSALEGQ